MKLLVINGPNINMLGVREPEIYGKQDYRSLLEYIQDVCNEEGIEAEFFQSNYEGAIIDAIQQANGRVDGIIINPAAYSHTSIAILDSLKAVSVPSVEVHLTDISTREEFRKISYTSLACLKTFKGFGFDGYRQAILYLKVYIIMKRRHP